MKWISVKYDLPEISTDKDIKAVLVYCVDGTMYVAERIKYHRHKEYEYAWRIEDTNFQIGYDGDSEIDESVTHWMPLPKPPTP